MINKIKSCVLWKDLLLLFLIAGLTMFVTTKLYNMHDTKLITDGKDVYFQGDLPRTYENMTDRMSSGHYRLKVHPLLSLQTFPPTFIIKKLGLSSYEAVKTVTVMIAVLWSLSLYTLMRLSGIKRRISLLFTALGLSSAAAVFWLSVPESYGIGSITIMVALSFAALANTKNFFDWQYVLISSITLSATITNWMAGIFVTLASKSIKQTINITLLSLSVVTIFWGLEKHFFPAAIFFLGDGEETSYIFFPNVERILSVISSFMFHSVIAPSVHILGDNSEGWSMISFQETYPASDTILNISGALIWMTIIAIGVWALITLKDNLILRVTLASTIVGQFMLHLIYGEETFLYSLHFLPLLILLAALGTLTSLRKLVIFLVFALIPIIVVNNWDKFKEVNTIAVSPHKPTNQLHIK